LLLRQLNSFACITNLSITFIDLKIEINVNRIEISLTVRVMSIEHSVRVFMYHTKNRYYNAVCFVPIKSIQVRLIEMHSIKSISRIIIVH
jgi:hypothetical protein